MTSKTAFILPCVLSIVSFWKLSKVAVINEELLIEIILLMLFQLFLIMIKLLSKYVLKFKKYFMTPFYGWGSTVSRLQSCYEETVYFLPLGPQEFLEIILFTSCHQCKSEISVDFIIIMMFIFLRYVFLFNIIFK